MTDMGKEQRSFRDKRFEIEHALNLYAYSYVHLPAAGIYEEAALTPHSDTIENCHIYFIGYLPIVSVIDATQSGNTVFINLDCLGERTDVSWEFPEGARLKHADGYWFVEARDGQRYAPTPEHVIARLGQQNAPLEFEVKYIGQSYGRGGSRSARDRLLSHETLQKIALRQAPEGYEIVLVLVEVQPANRLVTVFNPHAKERDEDGSRVQAGLDKLFGTDERERVALYEAAMIRYFEPEFNIEFKDSFPSTRLKLLQDCYRKDFSAVIAEFCFDDLPFVLRSQKVAPAPYHIASHNLHTETERRTFFLV